MRHRWISAVVMSLFFSVAAVPAFAQTTTVSAGSIEGMAGQTVAVPVSMTVPSGTQVATMQFNLTVVPNGSAPMLADQVTFTSNVGAPSLDLDNGLSTRLVGWFNNFSPALTDTVDVGTLNVVIPGDAQVGDTYAVQVLNPSGTTDGETDLPMAGEAGQIEVPPPPTATETLPPPTATSTPLPATETATPLPATLTPTKAPATLTPTKAPATLTPVPQPTAAIQDDDGCQISANGSKSSGWLLLIPAAVLFVTRRRKR